MTGDVPQILIAEDDSAIREGLVDLLESEGFSVTAAADGTQAIEQCQRMTFDLVILDIMMPGKSGFDVCRFIRRSDEQTPILFLTAKSEEVDKVLGLELGADDYLTKPFGLRECIARVRALLRRSQIKSDGETQTTNRPHLPEKFTFCAALIDRSTYTAILPGKAAEALTAREMKLIEIFIEHAGHVLTRDELLNLGWGIDYYGTTRTLDQHVAQLRKKCERIPAKPECLQTIHAVGYRYATTDENAGEIVSILRDASTSAGAERAKPPHRST